MVEHSSSWFRTLTEVAAAPGGGRLIVAGSQPRSSRTGNSLPYWSGARFAPTETLFEALLRPLLVGRYDRIVAFTGHGLKHLPKSWSLGNSLQLGDEAFIWVVKGAASPPQTPLKGAERSGPFHADLSRLKTSAQVKRLLWRSEGQTYWDRVEKLIVKRDDEIAEARERELRLALVIDDQFLRPTAFEWQTFTRDLGLDQRRSVAIARQFPLPSDLGRTDIIIFAEDGLITEMLEPEGNYIATALSFTAGEEWPRFRGAIEPMVPRLLLGKAIATVRAERRELPYRSTQLSNDATAPRSAYSYLRSARLEARRSSPEPPDDSRLLDLEFWANIDLSPIQRAFRDEIIGQADTTRGILSMLEEFRDRCRDVLAMDPSATRTAEDRELRPPVVNLFGAAGMGKTTICNLMARELFGDERFSSRVELSNRRLATMTIGVNAPYVGWDQETPLIRFARETRGLGLLCFDELTRVELDQGQTLSDALSSLLDLLDTRTFVPANTAFRPPEKRYYMTNTIFVFAANVNAGASTAGFKSIDDLGEPLRRRLFERRGPFFFAPLAAADYREAFRRSVVSAARAYARSMARNQQHLVAEPVVDDALLDMLVSTFESQLNASGETPSLALVSGVTSRLRLSPAFQKAVRDESPALVIGREVMPAAEGFVR